MHEPLEKAQDDVKDLNRSEVSLLVPACILVVVIGLYPKVIVDRVAPSAHEVLHVHKTVKSFSSESDHGGGH